MEFLNFFTNSGFLTSIAIGGRLFAIVLLFFNYLAQRYSLKQIGNSDPPSRKVGITFIYVIYFLILTDALPAAMYVLRQLGFLTNLGLIAAVSTIQPALIPVIGIYVYRPTYQRMWQELKKRSGH